MKHAILKQDSKECFITMDKQVQFIGKVTRDIIIENLYHREIYRLSPIKSGFKLFRHKESIRFDLYVLGIKNGIFEKSSKRDIYADITLGNMKYQMVQSSYQDQKAYALLQDGHMIALALDRYGFELFCAQSDKCPLFAALLMAIDDLDIKTMNNNEFLSLISEEFLLEISAA